MWDIPFFQPDFGVAELEAVQRPIRAGWLTMGPITIELEAEFCRLTGARYAIAVSNCTAALHLALLALRVGPGDEVIVPSMTFVASANAARYCGAKPVFADIVGETDLTIDPNDVRDKINEKTKAIIVVHYAGFPAHMEPILQIARQHKLIVVEDVAHALGTKLNGRYLGRFGACGCFSFFSTKNITCGEGGMIVTDDECVANQLKLLRSHGMTSLTLDRYKGAAWSYDCLDTGWNFRIDEIRASLAIAQLARLPEFLEKRRQVRQWYLAELESFPIIPFARWDNSEPETTIGYHIMPVILPAGTDRERVMNDLKSSGIQTSIHYPPAHRFSVTAAECHPELPITDDIASRELTLPFYPNMSRQNVKKVCEVLCQATSFR